MCRQHHRFSTLINRRVLQSSFETSREVDNLEGKNRKHAAGGSKGEHVNTMKTLGTDPQNLQHQPLKTKHVGDLSARKTPVASNQSTQQEN
jgi:hypothetical protein